MTPVEKARDAVMDRISTLAVDAGPDALARLAEAYASVVHGGQGGVHRQSTVYRYDGKTEYDYHSTHHRDDSRPAPGFSE